MTENLTRNVTLPLGRGAGSTVPLAEAISHIAVEMLEKVRDMQGEIPNGALPVAELERYAIALLILANQLEPGNNLDELAKAAGKLGLHVPPDWP